MTRTRSEYRLDDLETLPVDGVATTGAISVRLPGAADRDELAALLLAAYRGTVDDEGEDLADAIEAIEHYDSILLPGPSVVVTDCAQIVAMSFVVVVDDVHYIDPVVVAPTHQRRHVGRDSVVTSLRALAADGVTSVGATITDGNVASERLFAALGFRRVGSWG